MASEAPIRQHRSRLKDFYGIAETAASKSEPTHEQPLSIDTAGAVPLPVKTKTQHVSIDNPLNLNSKVFQSDQYMQQLLAERSLKSILRTECDLVTEIKTLDGDMKTLVYENYEKFISASDTIKKMKTNVENMEAQMTLLGEQISVISQNSIAISSSLAPKRKEIRNLGAQHNLLKRLQFIFDLPVKLQICLEKQKYTDALRFYIRSASLFEHYRDLAGFSSLESECKHIIQVVISKVRDRATEQHANMIHISEYIGCLLANGSDPRELCKEYINLTTQRLKHVKGMAHNYNPQFVMLEKPSSIDCETKAFDLSARVAASESGFKGSIDVDLDFLSAPTSSQPTSRSVQAPDAGDENAAKEEEAKRTVESNELIIQRVRYLNETYLQELCFFLNSYYSMFLTETKGPKKQGALHGVTLSSDHKFFVVHLNREVLKLAKRDLDDAFRLFMHDFFTTIEGFLTLKDSISRTIPTEDYITILETLFTDVNNVADKSEYVKGSFLPRALSLIGVFLSRTIHDMFKFQRDQFLSNVKSMDEKLANMEGDHKLTTFVEQLVDMLSGSTMPHLLHELKTFVSTDCKFMVHYLSNFQEAVRFELKSFWNGLFDDMKKFIANTTFRLTISGNDSYSRTILILVMVRIGNQLFENVVNQSFEKFSNEDRLWPVDEAINRPVQSSLTSIEKKSSKSAAEIEDVTRKFNEVNRLLLLRFVESAANEFVVMIRKSSETRNWVVMKEPRRVSKLWEQIISDLDQLDKDVSQLYAPTSQHAKAPQPVGNDNQSVVGSDLHSVAKRSHGQMSNVPSASAASYGVQSIISNRSSFFAGSASHMMGRIGGALQSNFMNNLDKLFSERTEIYTKKIEPENRIGIMTSILRIILKAFLEISRLRTFGRCGYQQIQVDVEYLRQHIWRFVADDKFANTILDEIMSSVTGRCIDVVNLEQSVVDRIIQDNKDVIVGVVS